MAPQKIIIDCDPGIDDVLAISLALNNPKDLAVLFLTSTHGNIHVEAVTKNLVALMNVMKNENEARARLGLPVPQWRKPTISIGANKPIIKEHGHGEIPPEDGLEGYHGVDGLNGLHARNPNLVSPDFLEDFRRTSASDSPEKPYIPSNIAAHDEILNQLRNSEPKSIILVALGPCTNLSLALSKDPETFHRVQKICIMGGAVRHAGNMTPVAEFNIYGDPDAAADIFNLSSPSKAITAYGRIPVSIVPLDQSNYHTFTDETFNEYMKPLLENGRPLAVFLNQVMVKSFEKITRYSGKPLAQCHDPLTIYALIHPEVMTWETLDARVETTGLWTRGQTVVDGRGIPRWKAGEMGVIRDNGDWLHGDLGNQIDVPVGSGDDPSKFGLKLLNGIFESNQ